MSAPSRSPSLAEVFADAMDTRASEIHVALPGIVQSYDSSTQLASVQPSLLLRLVAEDGTVSTERLPVLNDVPVVFPRGGNFFVSLPLAAGDQVMVIVCERSLDLWKKKGGEVDPVDRRFHSFQGAVCYPGLYDGTKPIQNASGSDMVVGKDGGSLVTIKSGGDVQISTTAKVVVGASATEIDLAAASDFVALATKVATELNKIAATLATGSNGAGPVVFGTPYVPGSVAAAQVKAS